MILGCVPSPPSSGERARVTGDGTTGINFTLPSAFAVTGTVDVSAASTLTIANTTNPTLGTVSAGTVAFTATSPQTVPISTYGNLSVSTTGGSATAAGAITANIALTIASGSILDLSTFALGGASLTTSGSGTLKTQHTTASPIPTGKTWSMDVLYNSATAQTVVAGTYANLDISGGARTLINGGTINISGIYTPGTGALTVTGNTINFNGANGQTIPAATYNTITSSNNTRTLANGIIKIGGNFTPGSGNYTIGTSTVDFNGTAAQTIPVLSVASGGNYYTLKYSGTSIATLGGSMTAGGNVISAGAGTAPNGSIGFSGAAAHVLTINGDLVLTSGTVDWALTSAIASGSISLLGNITQASGITFTTTTNAVNGSIIFNGSGTIASPQTITLTANSTFQYTNLTIGASTTVQVNNSFVLTGSTTAAYIGTLSVNGIFKSSEHINYIFCGIRCL